MTPKTDIMDSETRLVLKELSKQFPPQNESLDVTIEVLWVVIEGLENCPPMARRLRRVCDALKAAQEDRDRHAATVERGESQLDELRGALRYAEEKVES